MTERPENAPDRDHPLLVAARYNDAQMEDIGDLPLLAASLGVEYADLEYIAEQRAMRIVLMESGRMDEVKSTEPVALDFDANERRRLVLFTSLYTDAILLGWRARKLTEQEA